MLAQNFKTAADLGIAVHEFDALAKVLGMLEREEVRHVKTVQCLHSGGDYSGLRWLPNFNMRAFAGESECGTTACVAGTADMLFKTTFAKKYYSGDLPVALANMFGRGIPCLNELITPAQAAIALRNYLTHGEPRWAEALSA